MAARGKGLRSGKPRVEDGTLRGLKCHSYVQGCKVNLRTGT
jgi:hypothetical protein